MSSRSANADDSLKNTYGTVFEKDFILKVKEITERITDLKYTDSVMSITNADYISGEVDSIVVSSLA